MCFITVTRNFLCLAIWVLDNLVLGGRFLIDERAIWALGLPRWTDSHNGMAVEHFMFSQHFQAAKHLSWQAILHKLLVLAPSCLGRFARELLYFYSFISSVISHLLSCHQLLLEKTSCLFQHQTLKLYVSITADTFIFQSLFWVHDWNFGDQALIVGYTMQYLSFLCHTCFYF